MSVELSNHLWQSTLFAVLAGLLSIVLKRNSARVRYGLWLAAADEPRSATGTQVGARARPSRGSGHLRISGQAAMTYLADRDIAPPGQEGWTRHQEKYREASFDGADGVVVQDQTETFSEPPPRLRRFGCFALSSYWRSHPSWPGGAMPIRKYLASAR